MYYDLPPKYSWAHKGENAAIEEAEKHSARITVVLTVRMDGISEMDWNEY